MNCPVCDYKMAETDIDCPRCARYGVVSGQSVPCKNCGFAVPAGNDHCTRCGRTVPLDYYSGAPITTITPSSGGSSAARSLGALLLVGGMIGLVYFMFYFDTSVSTGIAPGTQILGTTFPDRVNNLGLMADRQNGMIGSGVAAIVGVILFVAGQPRN